MKICICQMDIIWENKSENMQKCGRMIADAKMNGAEAIVFPELTLTGFTMNTAFAEYIDGPTVQFFCDMSRLYEIVCVFGCAISEQGSVYNQLVVTSKDGVLCRYSKLHPFSYGGESNYYAAGSSEEIIQLSDVAFGLTICYDLRFPELYQQLSKKAECIIVSANWPLSRSAHWDTLLRARAIENQCYIVGCNRCGNGNGILYGGGSIVISPDGSIISEADNYEQLIYADINTCIVNEVRMGFPLKSDRRTEIYRRYYE